MRRLVTNHYGGIMSVRKRKWVVKSTGEQKEAWIVDYTDQDGDRHIETFERKKDADAFHATVRVDVSRGDHIAPSKSETVAEAAERWIKRVEALGRERTTVRQYRQHINLHIAPRIGAVKVAHLTTAKAESFRDDLLAAMSRPLARKVWTSFKSILKGAKRGHVVADVSIGKEKRKRRLEIGVDIPSPAEIKRLLLAVAEADIRRRTLLTVVISTGLRASELRGLRWKDVDLKHSEIHVRQRADRFNVIGAPKSETSVRKVSFGSYALAALKEWRLACPKGEADLVFPTAGGGVEHHKNMLRSLDPILIAAGVVDKKGAPKYALHAMRHFYASWCINRKADGGRELPAKNVQQLLGHSSIVITMDTYGHLFPASNDRAELAAAEAALWA
jgi:integrase